LQNSGTVANLIQGNYVGLNAAGTGTIANGRYGVNVLTGADGTIIGTNGDGVNDAAEGNVISGNAIGIVLASNNDVVAGNLVGTDYPGTAGLGNSSHGISLGGTGDRIGTNADGTSDALERNVIAGNGQYGVSLDSGSGNTVAGNYIGTDATGQVALGNTLGG